MTATCWNAAMSPLGQKRPKLPWLPAAKSTTEQRVKFVPKGDLPMPASRRAFSGTTTFPFGQSTIEPRGPGLQDLAVRWT